MFDGVPAALTDSVARDLYGLESDEVLAPEMQPGIGAGAPGLALAGH